MAPNLRRFTGSSAEFHWQTGKYVTHCWVEPTDTVQNFRFLFIFLLISGTLPQSVQFSSVDQSCLTLCKPMDCSTPDFPVHHQLPEFTQIHVHWVSDAIQPFHPLSSPSPPAFNLSQHQGLFQWVSSSHQVAKVLEFQLQHQSFQWIFRTDFPIFMTPIITMVW